MRLGRVHLFVAFAFTVMADPVSSVAYAIEAAQEALDGDPASLVATMGVVVRALAIAGSAERHDADDPRVGPFGNSPDDTALAGRIPALEQDDDFQPLLHDPFLQSDHLDLQASQLLLVLALVEDSRLQGA